jgi:CheY-like chemotaxis protein
MGKILLIDDDDFFLEYTKMTLSEFKYDVVTASNGLEGIKILRNRDDINLVISDLQMPPGDWGGIWVMEQLQQLNTIPGIILSEKGTVSKAVESIKVGAKDYVEKTKIESELLAVVENVLLKNHSLNKEKNDQISSYFDLLENVFGDTWNYISSETKSFLGNAEKIYHKNANDLQFDFSVGIIELSKAIEVECNKTIVPLIKEYLTKKPDIHVFINGHGGSRIPLQKTSKNLMLGEISFVLRQPFVKTFCKDKNFDYASVLELNSFLGDLRNKYRRNDAAHSEVISVITFELLRSTILGIGRTSPLKTMSLFIKEVSNCD